MRGTSHSQTQPMPMEHITNHYHQMGGKITILPLGQYSPKSQHAPTQQIHIKQTQGKTLSPYAS